MSEIGFYRKPQYIKDLVKDLKNKETTAEKVLWRELRAQKFKKYKFYRQKAIFAYREESGLDRFFIADFYYHPKKLIIEVDGSIHNNKLVKDYDILRESLLKKVQYNIIRFSNDLILSDIDLVLHKINLEINN